MVYKSVVNKVKGSATTRDAHCTKLLMWSATLMIVQPEDSVYVFAYAEYDLISQHSAVVASLYSHCFLNV